MKKLGKQIFALLLVCVIAFTFLPVQANAAAKKLDSGKTDYYNAGFGNTKAGYIVVGALKK
jgi:hypothetical protein